MDAPVCRRVQEAMDAGTREEAEVLADGFELQQDVRRALQIDVDEAVLAMVDAVLDSMREPVAAFYGLSLPSREGASFLRYEHGGFYKPHVDRADVPSWPLTASRQVTVVLFLNSSRAADPAGGFGGGMLRLLPEDDDPVEIIPTEGTLVAFPARTLHEVTRVISGHRDTVVDWFY